MLGFRNAIKVADVPFPFQFAQLFNLLILAFTFFIPIYSAVSTESYILSPLIAFVTYETIWIINKVAMELETPFGCSENDISVKDLHAQLVESTCELTAGVCVGRCSTKFDRDVIQDLKVREENHIRQTSVPAVSKVAETLHPARVPSLPKNGKTQQAESRLSEIIPGLPAVDKPVKVPADDKVEVRLCRQDPPASQGKCADTIENQLQRVSLCIEQHIARLAKDLGTLTQSTSQRLKQPAPGIEKSEMRAAQDTGYHRLLQRPEADSIELQSVMIEGFKHDQSSPRKPMGLTSVQDESRHSL
jgi:hypothetical protein